MKRFLKFLSILVSLLSFHSSVVEAQKLSPSDPLIELEQRINQYLQSVLGPDEYLVFVNPRPLQQLAPATLSRSDRETLLPGVPGFRLPEPGKKISHFDMNDNPLGAEASRPPVIINLVLADSVPKATQMVIRRVLPGLANINKEKGDTVKVTVGALKRNIPEVKEPGFVESVMRYQKEFMSLFTLLGAFLLAYALINALGSIFQSRRQASDPQARPVSAKTGSETGASPVASGTSPSSDTVKKQPTREELYSRDSAFMSLTQDLVGFADRYPERISHLLTDWIQQGQIGIRNAAVLLHNFDLKTSESILQKLVPSDLDYIKTQFDSNFDKFSEENIRVIYLARIDLMKVTAYFSRRAKGNEKLEFLATVEDDILSEILRVVPPDVLAFSCSQVPTHRVAQIIKGMKAEHEVAFIQSLCKLEKLPAEKIENYTELLSQRYQEVLSFSFTTNTKAQTLSKIVRNMNNSDHQKRILNTIQSISKDLNYRVRSQVVIFDDLVNLPNRILQTIVVEENPEVVAHAVAKMDVPFQERVQSFMGPAAQEIFTSTISSLHFIRPTQIEKAQAKLVLRVEKMVDEKIIDLQDFKSREEEESAGFERAA